MKDRHEEMLSTSEEDGAAQLDALMTRIRETVRGAEPAASRQDDAPTHSARAPSARESATSGDQDAGATLTEQAEFNRLSLEFMQGLYSHLQRLEEDIARYQRTLERSKDLRLYAAPGSNGHKHERNGDDPSWGSQPR